MKQIIKRIFLLPLSLMIWVFAANNIQAIQNNQDNMNAERYLERGIVMFGLGDYQRAIKDFTQAISINSNYTNAYIARSNAYLVLEKYQEAIADSNKAIQLNPQSSDAYNSRCYAKSRGLKKYQEAVIDCDRAIKLSPDTIDSAAFYSSRCYARAGFGDKKALDDCEKAIILDPNYIYVYEDRGLARLLMGDKKEAISDFKEAAEKFSQRGDKVSYQRVQKLINSQK